MKPAIPPPVDEFDLELLEAGAEVSPERKAQILAEPSLAPARAEIAALEGWWARHQRPLTVPARGQRRWALWGLSLAAAAAAAVLLSLAPWEQGEPRFRPMGKTEIDVMRTRAGAPLEMSQRVAGGDQLSISLVPEEDQFVTVATLQEDGAVSLLVASAAAEGMERFELPGQLELDSYDGREWLVVSVSGERASERALESELRALLPDPPAHASDTRWVLEVTRGKRPR